MLIKGKFSANEGETVFQVYMGDHKLMSVSMSNDIQNGEKMFDEAVRTYAQALCDEMYSEIISSYTRFTTDR